MHTPGGIDRDFNFLSSFERKFREGEHLAEKIGIDLYGDKVYSEPKRQYKKRVALTRALRQSGIAVEKAPMGMARSKKNMTIYHTEKKCLEWTFELIDFGGKIRYSNALETVPLSVAAARVLPKSIMTIQTTTLPYEEDATKLASDHTANTTPKVHFYLQLVRTSCPEIVLLPVHETASLQNILKGRRIVEFPTFYFSPSNDRNELPAGFISEQSYKDRFTVNQSRGSVHEDMQIPAQDQTLGHAGHISRTGADDLAVAAAAAMS